MPIVPKSLLPRTLFGRAVLIIVLPLVLVQLVAIFVFYDRVWETVTRRLSQAVAGEIAMTVAMMSRADSVETRTHVLATAASSLGLFIEIDDRGRLAAPTVDEGSGILERRLIQALRERVGRPFALDVWRQPRDVVVEIQLDDATMRVRFARERVFTTTSYVMILWMVGSSIIFFAVASIFMRNQVRPIRRLAEAAEEFGKGRDDEPYRPAGASEVRQAGAAFVVMRERIRRFLQQRTEMLAGISHDLRTPLTRMKLELALLGDVPSVAGLRADVADMERMVDSYLAFVRGEGEEAPELVDLKAMLEDLVAAAQREGHSVRLVTEGDLTLPLRPQAIKRSIRNLLANATRHGARIDIRAKRRERSLKLTIDDDGPGIPQSAREDVFKPFFRLDASRNTATGGVGLGLTIARDVVRAHGGEIWLEDSPLGGLRARIKLPV
ncbi:MAG: HAMP domain-containing protein [Alphaproteobacteria bacterium]|nr:HAMP domain-containing protein [Alphaproteobacteria bacterium]